MAGKITDYATLYGLIEAEGLLIKDHYFYLRQLMFVLGLVAIGLLGSHYLGTNTASIVLLAAFWSFFQAQTGILGHDIIHQQVFKSRILTDIGSILSWNLILGASSGWWREQHNLHHAHPNDHHKDPSIDLALFSFSEEQLKKKTNFQKFFVKHQAYLYFPLMIFMTFALRLSAFRFTVKKRKRLWIIELAATSINLLIYPLLVFWSFGVIHGLIFIACNQAFLGLYLGLIFAPNHKGMPMIESRGGSDYFREQVITSRNIRGGFLTDVIYGGLNYQIEHHLFPFMARSKLKKAKPIVESFCRSRQITYHETNIINSFREIISALHEESLAVN